MYPRKPNNRYRLKPAEKRGYKNAQTKLEEHEVRMIRKFWESGDVTQAQMAEVYEVSRATINSIVNGKTWKHLGDGCGDE